jgi:hypothetical protein
MLRITRQADYGIVLLTYIVREVGQETVTAAELARRTLLPGADGYQDLEAADASGAFDLASRRSRRLSAIA